MPHWKSLLDNEYIGAYAFAKDEEITATIKSVTRKKIKSGPNADEKNVPIIAFEEKDLKPLVCNKTNAESIVKIVGSAETDDWTGKQITMYASTTLAFGEMKECVRIRPYVNKNAKRKIDDKRFAKALVNISNLTYSVTALLERYELTPEQTALLPKQIEGSVA